MAAGPTVRSRINFHLAEVRNRLRPLGVGPSYSNLLPGPETPVTTPQWFFAPVSVNALVPTTAQALGAIPPVPPLKDYIGTASISGVFTSRSLMSAAVSTTWTPQNQVTPIQLPPANWSPYMVTTGQPLTSAAATVQNPQVIQTFLPQDWSPVKASAWQALASLAATTQTQRIIQTFIAQNWSPVSAIVRQALVGSAAVYQTPPQVIQAFIAKDWSTRTAVSQALAGIAVAFQAPQKIQTFIPQDWRPFTATVREPPSSAVRIHHTPRPVVQIIQVIIRPDWSGRVNTSLAAATWAKISQPSQAVPAFYPFFYPPTAVATKQTLLSTTAVNQILIPPQRPIGSTTGPLRVQTDSRPPTYWPGRGTIH